MQKWQRWPEDNDQGGRKWRDQYASLLVCGLASKTWANKTNRDPTHTQTHSHTHPSFYSYVQQLMTVILVTWEVMIQRITVQGQSGQKVCQTPSQPMAGCGSICLSSPATQGNTNRRIEVQNGLGINQDPTVKITYA
jgi:hypothetical protein